jgi:CRP-like cAMP-binding protein
MFYTEEYGQKLIKYVCERLSKYDLQQYEDYLRYNKMKWFIKVATLKSGHSFGELALINNSKRAATIQVLSDFAYFVTIEKEEY